MPKPKWSELCDRSNENLTEPTELRVTNCNSQISFHNLIEKLGISNLKNLNIVNPSQDSVFDSSHFDKVVDISKLRLEQTNLLNFDNKIFQQLAKLQVLELIDDSEIPEHFLDHLRPETHYLRTLRIEQKTENSEEKGSISGKIFNQFSSLYELIISNYRIPSLKHEQNSMENLKNLVHLRMSGIEITELPNDIFYMNTNLTYIDLSENQLEKVPL